jgi:hypothetical protein
LREGIHIHQTGWV